jgi:hypothetical protein
MAVHLVEVGDRNGGPPVADAPVVGSTGSEAQLGPVDFEALVLVRQQLLPQLLCRALLENRAPLVAEWGFLQLH